MGEVRCSVCGSPEVAAKIEGKYYCRECGAKLLRENSKRLLEYLKKKYLEKAA
ncbi:MAG: TFIIB-type zinc finger domain-containing protein [Thermofilum sp.]